MPFKSDKQRRYLWSQKPEVAKEIAYKNEGGWWAQDTAATPMQIRNRQYAEYTRQGSPGKFKDWLAAGGGQGVDKTQPSIQKSARDVARVATPYGSVEDAYAAGQAAGAGNWGEAAGLMGMAALGALPVAGAVGKAARAAPVQQFARGAKMAAQGNPYGKHAMKGALGIGRQTKGPLQSEVAYATNKFMDPLPRIRPGGKIDRISQDLGGGETAQRIAVDMQREFADPSLAIGQVHNPVPIRPASTGTVRPGVDAKGKSIRAGTGAHPLDYKRYDLPPEVGSGSVHALYDPVHNNPANLLGGTGDLPANHYGPVFGSGKSRPAGGFEVVTKPMSDAGHPLAASKLKKHIPVEKPTTSTPFKRLSNDQVKSMRTQRKKGVSHEQLARNFGIPVGLAQKLAR